jgi:hypothetical protein
MAWVRWCVFAWTTFPQAVQAEQRSLLRASRAQEATPFITLPQSLLLQRSDGEKQGQVTGDEQGLSDTEASTEIKAANMRGGYGNELWNSVQESASEVVDDAREAFFARAQAAAAATTTAAPPAPTTTAAITTVDPATLATKLNITHDAARARNLLVAMISRAQVDLLNRLKDISTDLEATQLRAELDLKAVNHSFIQSQKMPIIASNADVDVKKIDVNGDQLKVAVPAILQRAVRRSADIAELMKSKKMVEENLKNSDALPGAKRRVQNNQVTLSAVVPRLERLERRVTKLESRLYDGDLNKMVDDSTGKEVVNVMEDVSRGFGRFVENA